MTVNNHRFAAIFSGPVVAHGQAKFISLPGRLSVQRKVTHLTRTTTLHLLFHSRVSDNKSSTVQNKVTDQRINELGDLSTKLRRLPVQLLQRIGESMRYLH